MKKISKFRTTISHFNFLLAVLILTLTGCGGGGSIGSKLDIPAPKIVPQLSIFAGATGRTGHDDGSIDRASFYLPQSVAVDKEGNIFVADSRCLVRKISNLGIVSTLAGSFSEPNSNSCPNDRDGLGAEAGFLGVSAVAVDSAGIVYVADSAANTIRHITSLGQVTTLAGYPFPFRQAGYRDANGLDARFSDPRSLAVDNQRNVYVADTGSSHVRKISPYHDVSTIFDPYAQGFMPRITLVAVDQAQNVYFIDENHGTDAEIYKIDQKNNNRVTKLEFAAGERLLDTPQGLAVDSHGNVFVSELRNHVIRKISPNGTSTIFAGVFGVSDVRDGFSNTARFHDPTGLATDANDNVYVADAYGTIRKISPAGFVTTIAGSAYLFGSDDGIGTDARFGQNLDYAKYRNSFANSARNGIAKDSKGNLYVSDTENHIIRKITPDRRVTTIAGKAGVSGSIDGQGGGARFSSPQGIVVDDSDIIYIADADNNTIRKMTLDGKVSTFAGAAEILGDLDGVGSAARFRSPQSIALDPKGFLVVADTYNSKLRKISKSGVVTSIPNFIANEHPVSVVADQNGNYFSAGVECFCILKTDTNNVTTIFAGGSAIGHADGKGAEAKFYYPLGLTSDNVGNIFLIDGGIRKITPDGLVKTLDLDTYNYRLYGNLVFNGTTAYVMGDGALFQILNAKN